MTLKLLISHLDNSSRTNLSFTKKVILISGERITAQYINILVSRINMDKENFKSILILK